jgi:hypothetical protein
MQAFIMSALARYNWSALGRRLDGPQSRSVYGGGGR